MKGGRIIEDGATDTVLNALKTEHARELLGAVLTGPAITAQALPSSNA